MLPENRYVIKSERLAAALGRMGTEPAKRTDNSSDFGHFPLDPEHLDGADGVIFIKHIARVD